GARRLRVLRVEGERITIDEGVRDIGVVLPRLHKTEITGLTTSESRQVVEPQMDGGNRVSTPFPRIVKMVVTQVLTLSANGPNQLNDRVVEVELHPDLAGFGAESVHLELRDQLLERTDSKPISLGHI